MTARDKTSIIGKSIPRADAFTKVTGREKYAADYYSADMLWAGAKRAGIPHGLLKNIDIAGAQALPGVVAILTHKDIAGPNRQGIVRKDHHVLVDGKIHYAGDAVALVIAENRKALRKALETIKLDIEELPGVFDPEEALLADAPIVHEENETGNLLREISIRVGEGADPFVDLECIAEGIFEVPSQEHTYLETEAGFAWLDEKGKLVIIASTQTPFRDRTEIGYALGFKPDDIHVIAPYLGGGFGGKDGVTVQCLLGLAALFTKGRPVKMWWDREESFLAGVKRLPARMYYKVGAKHDGTLSVLQCRLYFNAGAYASLCGEVMTLAVEHAGGAYRIPNVAIDAFCVYTNNPVGGPFRGFGVPQVTAAIEQMIDVLAEKLSMDPLKIRLRNAVKRGDKQCLGITLEYSTGAKECLQAIASHPLWKDRESWKKDAPPFKLRGVGLSLLSHAMGYPAEVPDFANARIELTDEGMIRVYAGVVDMGQGNASTNLQIAGEICAQDPSTIELVLPDTERTMPSGSAAASRCTYVFGNALIIAANELKRRMLDAASSYFVETDTTTLEILQGKIMHRETQKTITFSELVQQMDPTERIAEGYFKIPVTEEGKGVIYMGPHCIYSYGAHLVYIEIDELTGKVEVNKYLAASDAGKMINPQVYEQQIQGGIAQGMGYALMEDFIVERGHIKTPDLATYIIPTFLDVPEMTSVPVELGEETGPFGIKGIGEISVNGPLPAIANAIADASGLRIQRAPFTAERVLGQLEKKR